MVALEKSPGYIFKSLLNLLSQCTNNDIPDIDDCNAEEISNQILLQIGCNVSHVIVMRSMYVLYFYLGGYREQYNSRG